MTRNDPKPVLELSPRRVRREALARWLSSHRAVAACIGGVLILLAVDVFSGSFILSLFLGPMWLLFCTLAFPRNPARSRGTVLPSLSGALILLVWDAVFSGSYGMSFLVCPIWLFVSVVKNAIQRPGLGIGFARAAIPALTLAIVLINDHIQHQMAKENAARVVAACEQFHVDKGRFPKTLDEVVPEYLPNVPRAKYCLNWGEFWYISGSDHPMLIWYDIPPFGRCIYDFNRRSWSWLD